MRTTPNSRACGDVAPTAPVAHQHVNPGAADLTNARRRGDTRLMARKMLCILLGHRWDRAGIPGRSVKVTCLRCGTVDVIDQVSAPD